MLIQTRTLRNTGLLVTGIALALSVSLATAAILMWSPNTPVVVVSPGDQQVANSMGEYVHLHHARNAVVPNYLGVDVEKVSR